MKNSRTIRISSCLIALAISSGIALATDYTWVGTSSTPGTPGIGGTYYEVPGNWSPSGPPAYSFAGSHIAITNGSLVETVNLSSHAGAGTVNIGEGSTLTINNGGTAAGAWFNTQQTDSDTNQLGLVIGNGSTGTVEISNNSFLRNTNGRMALGGSNAKYGSPGYGVLNISGDSATAHNDYTTPSSQLYMGNYTIFYLGGNDGGTGIVNQAGGTIQYATAGRTIYMGYFPAGTNAYGKAQWNITGGNAFGIAIDAGRSGGSDIDLHLSNDAYIEGKGEWRMGMQWTGVSSPVDISQSDTSSIDLDGDFYLASRKDAVAYYILSDQAALNVSGTFYNGNTGTNVFAGIHYEEGATATLEIAGAGVSITNGIYEQNATSKLLINAASTITVTGTALFEAGAVIDSDGAFVGGSVLAMTAAGGITDEGIVLGSGVSSYSILNGATELWIVVVAAPPVIVDSSFISSTEVKLVVNTPGASERYIPQSTDNLVLTSFAHVAHSDTAGGSYATTNLSYSTTEGTNVAIYVDATDAACFFKISGE